MCLLFIRTFSSWIEYGAASVASLLDVLVGVMIQYEFKGSFGTCECVCSMYGVWMVNGYCCVRRSSGCDRCSLLCHNCL
jgi:hypothetical protein